MATTLETLPSAGADELSGEATALSSLIFTLDESPSLRAAALAALAARPDLQLGEVSGPFVPAVLDAADPRAAFRDLEALPGVRLVEVVFVELPAPATAP
jgi:hypothetical protein